MYSTVPTVSHFTPTHPIAVCHLLLVAKKIEQQYSVLCDSWYSVGLTRLIIDFWYFWLLGHFSLASECQLTNRGIDSLISSRSKLFCRAMSGCFQRLALGADRMDTGNITSSKSYKHLEFKTLKPTKNLTVLPSLPNDIEYIEVLRLGASGFSGNWYRTWLASEQWQQYTSKLNGDFHTRDQTYNPRSWSPLLHQLSHSAKAPNMVLFCVPCPWCDDSCDWFADIIGNAAEWMNMQLNEVPLRVFVVFRFRRIRNICGNPQLPV